MKKRILFIFLSAVLLGMTACNKSFNKVMKNPDPKFRLEKAYEYYNQGKYEKAQPLFEEHLTLNKGIKNSEEVLFLYAYCYYYLKDYTLGAFYFRNFMTSYPRSEKVEEAAYMMAVCYEKESPRESLDQTNTVKAIDQYQSFANRFPNSAKIHDANEAIDRLRAKIEGKAYKSAYLYYKIKEYKAATVALKALLKDYPGIENQDKIQYYIVKSNKYYADNSASSKKYERYEETAKECTTFREKYQGSQYLTEVNDIYLKSVAQLKIYKDYEHTRKKDGRD
ncbi:MAG: outer membrane protein assembly factor BamD [Chitinophagales bacterium]|nr:outer membrane protein assembly factor BamD [Chitinophagales bacterium]